MLCGPSRLVWFGIGSLATYAWIRHHRDHCPPRVDYQRRGGDGRGQWEREEAPPPPPPSGPNYGEWRQNQNQWRPAHQSQGQGPTTTGAPPTPTPHFDSNSTHVVPPPGGPAGGQLDQETQLLESLGIPRAEHERLRQIGRSAEETISGMSEATIDGMMGALQRLKDRLAERRGQQMQETGSQQANPTPATSPSPERPPQPRHWV
ncbi:hypothetical protein DFH94DRAFT_695248 [Russula ochroleuca]|uniref:Uncharacterized protein n=1 Tax=Russula ochroleuca TaxID=152965 RepID=A0A9P5K054_9AGAM|nr:hypothetical protein DFH94DRAFT_695248 [Russula ochroleuca]